MKIEYPIKFKTILHHSTKQNKMKKNKAKAYWSFGISPEGFGTVTMIINFVVSIVIMKFTPEPSTAVQDIVENNRIPSGIGEVTH